MTSAYFAATSALILLALAGVAAGQAAGQPAGENARISPEQRRAFFGELHLHTALSLDAWTYGTKVLPDDAYRFGKGETIMVPAVQVAIAQGLAGERDVPARRAWPLDFMAVTDHAENLGTLLRLDDPTSEFARSELGRRILADPNHAMALKTGVRRGGVLPRELDDPQIMRHAWGMAVKAANDHYQPGQFTTFIAYEWSALPNGRNLHRNVIFNADRAPLPFHADQSQRPEDLWSYLENVRAQGIDVLAIPHNANASGGLMFDWNDSSGRPIDEAYAQRRVLNEPLVEIAQIKGQSDTLPVLSPYDEFAGFEIFDRLLGPLRLKSAAPGSYVRDAYGRGLVIQSQAGANPFKFGLVAASDIHNGLSTSDERASAGGQFGIDPEAMLPRGEFARRALGLRDQGSDDLRRTTIVERSSGGLAGVWAEENTRDSIFAALKRKETFATSGSRIRVRTFGGWDFTPGMLAQRDWVARAYARGVPMGNDLPAPPRAAAAPTFILEALKDPDGANLDRIQIIKLWLEGEEYREKIFDVAVSDNRRIDPRSRRAPPLQPGADTKTDAYDNTIGAPVLTTVWKDPQFDPATPAVYYARVLEIPTPRWSTLLAVKNDLPLSQDVAPTIQERAWSSPIWFTPRMQPPRR